MLLRIRQIGLMLKRNCGHVRPLESKLERDAANDAPKMGPVFCLDLFEMAETAPSSLRDPWTHRGADSATPRMQTTLTLLQGASGQQFVAKRTGFGVHGGQWLHRHQRCPKEFVSTPTLLNLPLTRIEYWD